MKLKHYTDTPPNNVKTDTLTPEQQRPLRRLARTTPGLGKLLAQIHPPADCRKHDAEIRLRVVQSCLKDICELEWGVCSTFDRPLSEHMVEVKAALQALEQKIKRGEPYELAWQALRKLLAEQGAQPDEPLPRRRVPPAAANSAAPQLKAKP